MNRAFLLVICIWFLSCSQDENKIRLPGKIAIEQGSDSCYIFDNADSVTTAFNTRPGKTSYYSGLAWNKQRDQFFCVNFFEMPSQGVTRGNVVRLDLSGKVIDTIYSSQSNEVAGNIYPSVSDKRLLFTSKKLTDADDTSLAPFSSKDLIVMALPEKNIITRIRDFGGSRVYFLYESPWLYDEERFIFSVGDGAATPGDNVTGPAGEAPGVYVYDIKTNQKKMMVPDADYGVCSPEGLQIAYIKNNTVFVMDIQKNEEKLLSKFSAKQKIRNIHWTPDEKYIYIAYYKYFLGVQDLFSTAEKLIEVKTGKEIPFYNIAHGFDTYTWR